ncbi:MAG: ABC transporter ATP-binding protein, partial [Rhodocyclaceae bacterium]|nr:ABC transporter ATP-binding protein [Rhodocyclaceae bacterium]
RDRIALADDARYDHYRHQVLQFLYEIQLKVETLGAAKFEAATASRAV